MRKPKDIKIGNYTLEEILIRHKHWLNEDCENWKYMQADLHDADLRDADLRGTDMRGADLHGADLRDAIMRDANMRGAKMCGANMGGAIMVYTDLRGANMCGTIMRGANMRGTDLSYADLSYADLRGTDMCGADLSYADMRGANMCNANMRGANIFGANMCGADRLRKGIKLSEPIIGWKKCKNNVLVKLEIPRGAIVFSINNNKCRTDKAKVLEIIGGDRAYSMHKFFSYYVGDIIEVFNFNCEYNVECAEGIHFLRKREEAEKY